MRTRRVCPSDRSGDVGPCQKALRFYEVGESHSPLFGIWVPSINPAIGLQGLWEADTPKGVSPLNSYAQWASCAAVS